jgi:hypothetical protein
LQRNLQVALGLALGLLPSCVTSEPDGADGAGGTDAKARARVAAEAELSAPLVAIDDPAPDATASDVTTGSVCAAGPHRCFAHVHARPDGSVRAYTAAQGFGPADLQAAYAIPTTLQDMPTIAVIDAFGYTALESDLATYRANYGLPACTTANGCLTIVNATGQTSPLPGPPPTGDDWTLETALDVDMISAACPSCRILVVQATDDMGETLYTGQNTAAQMGATVISNSWGGPEQPGQSPPATPVTTMPARGPTIPARRRT